MEIKYATVTEIDQNEFTQKMANLLADGWSPLGGMGIFFNHNCDTDFDTIVYYQAVVKTVEKRELPNEPEVM